MSRIESRDPSAHIPGRARAFVYVVVCQDEDILKIGFSRDPLIRLRSFHPRYFAFFDIERSFLIETDRVTEARAIERCLAQNVDAHRAPSPLLVDRAAGGHTEWFRGAFAAVRADAASLMAQFGYRRHASLRDWLRARLIQEGDVIFEWSSQMLRAIEILDNSDAREAARVRQTLQAALEAYDHFDLPTDPLLCEEVREWWREHKAR